MPNKMPKAGLMVTAILLIAIATAWMMANSTALADRPPAPTGITVSATSENTVDVSWTAHPNGASDYRVAWKPANEGWKAWDNYDWNAYPSGTSHTITGLEPDKTYKVRVKARFESGPSSGWSSPQTITTPEATPEPTPEPGIDYDQERSESVSLGDITDASAANRNENVDTADPVDYFHFSPSAKRDIGLRIRRLDLNADLYIEDNEGNVLHSSENSGNQREVLKVTLAANNASEYYYVRVEAKEDGVNDYQFRYFAEAPPNAAATGQPTILGTAQVQETLTASTTAIANDNGLSGTTFAYQWVRTANGTDTDVSGATGSTFLLTQNELDHTIAVRVSFTDDAGYAETVTSRATRAVVQPPNVSPSGLPTIRGVIALGKTLTADTSGITDNNGLSGATFTYQWVRNTDNADADINGETGSTYTLTASDAGSSFKVTVSFTDDAGYSESVTSAPTEVLPSQEQADQGNAIQPRTDTVTQTAAGATWTLTGTQSPTAGQQYTYTITLASGTKPNNEYMGFYLANSATNQDKLGLNPDNCTSPKEFCASFTGFRGGIPLTGVGKG